MSKKNFAASLLATTVIAGFAVGGSLSEVAASILRLSRGGAGEAISDGPA